MMPRLVVGVGNASWPQNVVDSKARLELLLRFPNHVFIAELTLLSFSCSINSHSVTNSKPYLHEAFLLTFSSDSICSISMMYRANSVSSDSTSKHVSGDWYSVPELRLCDHLFTIPLDYTLDIHSSPKISIFAREVVAAIFFFFFKYRFHLGQTK